MSRVGILLLFYLLLLTFETQSKGLDLQKIKDIQDLDLDSLFYNPNKDDIIKVTQQLLPGNSYIQELIASKEWQKVEEQIRAEYQTRLNDVISKTEMKALIAPFLILAEAVERCVSAMKLLSHIEYKLNERTKTLNEIQIQINNERNSLYSIIGNLYDPKSNELELSQRLDKINKNIVFIRDRLVRIKTQFEEDIKELETKSKSYILPGIFQFTSFCWNLYETYQNPWKLIPTSTTALYFASTSLTVNDVIKITITLHQIEKKLNIVDFCLESCDNMPQI